MERHSAQVRVICRAQSEVAARLTRVSLRGAMPSLSLILPERRSSAA
jgi:hypothetical protein